MMTKANGIRASSSQRQSNASNAPTTAYGFATHPDPEVSKLPANETSSQWPLPVDSSNLQSRNNSQQPYEFPTPPMSAFPSQLSSARASTISSAGSIPDFPLPKIPVQAVPPRPRKNQDIGPPPSARRPGPKYITRDSYVTPIVEESPEVSPRSAAFGSRAASNRSSRLGSQLALPQNHHAVEKGESDVPQIATRDDATRLIRQASRARQPEPRHPSAAVSGDLTPRRAGNFRFPFQSPTLSRSSSEYELDAERPQISTFSSFSKSPLLAPAEDGSEQLPSPCAESRFEPSHALSEKIPSSRRPPRLDLDSVRDAEARGSLTSLPELIKRATKLAANLDRGKTASRLGMLDMFNSSEKLGRERTDGQSVNGSMSDMLAAFPRPGATPDPFGSRRESYQEKRAIPDEKSRGRRCCGMSICVFTTLCILLLLLIAAAVLIPIFLIVIPQQHQAQKDAASQVALGTCQTSLPCSNNGISVISNDACQCICVEGFTGSQCTTQSDPGCTTSDITSDAHTFNNATLGTSIPRLFSGSSSNFSIPLNSTALLSLFAANSLSCTSEDALVTFNAQSSKLKRFYIVPNEQPLPTPTSQHSSVPTSKIEVVARLEVRSNTVATSAGIVFQQSTSTAPVATATGSASATSGASSTATTASGSQASGASSISQDTLDFARVAVLFVFEQTANLDSAINAQQYIQTNFMAINMSTTLDFHYRNLNVTADFGTFGLTFANGTVLGGKGNGSGSLG